MEELKKALELIKKECSHHSSCSDCPFRSYDNDCAMAEKAPSYWDLTPGNRLIF